MQAGEIRFDGQDFTRSRSEAVVQAGIVQVPQGRRLFPSLTVDEHLHVVLRTRRGIPISLAVIWLELAQSLGLPARFNLGDVIKELLLGSSEPGQHSLIRFYTLHCVFLPLLAAAAVAAHLWRIRKDGGLARPPAE